MSLIVTVSQRRREDQERHGNECKRDNSFKWHFLSPFLLMYRVACMRTDLDQKLRPQIVKSLNP